MNRWQQPQHVMVSKYTSNYKVFVSGIIAMRSSPERLENGDKAPM